MMFHVVCVCLLYDYMSDLNTLMLCSARMCLVRVTVVLGAVV